MHIWMSNPCNLRCHDWYSHEMRQYVLRVGLLRRRNSAGLRSIAMHGKTSALLTTCLLLINLQFPRLLINLHFPLLILIFCVATVRPRWPFAGRYPSPRCRLSMVVLPHVAWYLQAASRCIGCQWSFYFTWWGTCN
jgi:hypothetical protein